MGLTVVFQVAQDVEIGASMSGKGDSARVALLTSGNISVTAEVFVDQMTSLCKFKHLGCTHEESHGFVQGNFCRWLWGREVCS